MKFIHAADLHLDSPLRGLESYEGAPVEEIRGATREALKSLVALAIEEQVSFVIVAGDLYDGDWQDYNTGLFFGAQMTRLREADIPVYTVSGNHDAQSRMSRNLTLPDNVIVFPANAPWTHRLLDGAVAIHGQSYARQDVKDDLSAGYPEPVGGALNIGVLHTNIDSRPGHDNYAPTSLARLRAHGYDYWALGHVHTAEVLSENPWVVYPGCLQGRHIRETGAKGCRLVEVRDGQIVSCEHRDLDVLRWHLATVDIDGVETVPAVVHRAVDEVAAAEADAGGRILAVRVVLQGETPAHDDLVRTADQWHADLRARVTDVSGGRVWIERIRMEAHPPTDLRELESGDHALGDLLRAIRDLDADEARLAELAQTFEDLAGKLPSELKEEPHLLDVTDPATVHGMLGDVRSLLLSRIRQGAAQ